jgi:hypothetical protein
MTRETETDAKTAQAMIHCFEQAGLGKAPYRYLGIETKVGPIRIAQPDGTVLEIGSPGQPMSHCDFCQTPISNECWLRSADGKRFKVGTDCIERAGDRGLRLAMAPDLLKRSHAKDDARIAAANGLMSESVRAKLSSEPHPYPHMAAKGHTALSFVEYNFSNAGRAGKIKAARMIERTIDATDKAAVVE